MNLEDAVETAENMVQQQVVQEVWDGLTVWLLNMAVVCRELQMWRLLYWMF